MERTHKEYLESILASKKLILRELQVQHRIDIAEYNAKRELIDEQIMSIECQLEEGKE